MNRSVTLEVRLGGAKKPYEFVIIWELVDRGSIKRVRDRRGYRRQEQSIEGVYLEGRQASHQELKRAEEETSSIETVLSKLVRLSLKNKKKLHILHPTLQGALTLNIGTSVRPYRSLYCSGGES